MIASRLLRHWFTRLLAPDRHIREKYDHFKELLRSDSRALDLIADLDAHLYGHDPADAARIRFLVGQLTHGVREMADSLCLMNPQSYALLPENLERIAADITRLVAPALPDSSPPYVLSLDEACDHPGQAGGKAANLSFARRHGVPTPPGFVVTASAFARYLRDNDLEEEVELRFRDISLSNHDAIVRVTGELQELILAARVPQDVRAEIMDALRANGLEGRRLAVRSSAVAEDGEISFAGQYASELDVAFGEVLSAYKRVLAGKYCPRAVAYRIRHGLTDFDTAMAVLILPMVEAQAAGVVYTRDPACAAVGGKAVGVYVVGGLAAHLVDGSATPGKHYLTRDPEPDILMGCACESAPMVTDAVLRELGAWCMRLEGVFGQPQDVEWALGPEGLLILQTRRLQQDEDREAFSSEEAGVATVLVSELDCASPGAACGPVIHVASGADFRSIPPGSVVVTSSLRPALSQFLDRISGIVAASGSRASHLASVARERGVPVVVGCGAGILPEGSVVTVDGGAGRIFAGCLPGVMALGRDAERMHARIRAGHEELAAMTVHLGLIDPEAENFTPDGCRSLHDVVRFCHEKSVAEMFSLVGRGGRGLGRSRRLVTDLPLVMYVLDLGGGISPQAGARGPVDVGLVDSAPLRAMWDGLADGRVAWDRSQLHVDWEEFDRVSSGLFRLDSRILASYAIVAREYMHLNIRFGYHFSIVDALCGDIPGANYVKFRFKGGGAALNQRSYRLVFVRDILERFGYETMIRGDMLDASLGRLDATGTSRALHALGLVLAVTRLMDIRLSDVPQARQEAAAFMHRFFPEVGHE
jgi:pyruvate,water dikinase